MRANDGRSGWAELSDEGSYGAAGDDAAVIARSVSDPEHFAVLFRRHAPAIQRYVIRRIGPQAADYVVAETFLVALRQGARVHVGAGYTRRPWATTRTKLTLAVAPGRGFEPRLRAPKTLVLPG